MPPDITNTRQHILRGITTTLALFVLSGVHADSMRSECGNSPSAQTRPETTSSCVFSQRQGYISINIDGGPQYVFAPTGESPGNYRDQTGNQIYRIKGLGDEGQLFKLPKSYLYIFWNPSHLQCNDKALIAPGQCQLRYGKLTFDVHASTDNSLNQLKIQPRGLTAVNRELLSELDGNAYRAELADLDGNGWPEIYIYVSSAGSGSYGSLVAYAINNGKSASPIYLPPLQDSPETSEGYMGHDEFSVVENRLVRRFPIYKNSDTNANPGGETLQIQYRLEAGEAGWILQVDRVVKY